MIFCRPQEECLDTDDLIYFSGAFQVRDYYYSTDEQNNRKMA